MTGRRCAGWWVAWLGVGLTAPAVEAVAQVEADARVERSSIALGESTRLDIVVRGAAASEPPEFQVPAGLEAVAAGRSQSFSWVNGRSSSEIAFRYELIGRQEGTYAVGPFRVRAGRQTLEVAALSVTVVSSPPSVGGGETEAADAGLAQLRLEVSPESPWVGEPVLLRVRLVQSAPLAEDPRYSPPPTTGFWSERPSAPESYYAQSPGGRVLVTEPRTRLYPLEAGRQTMGPAAAVLILQAGSQFDPFGWFGGRRRAVEVVSDTLVVRVRPLPAGAPEGYDGAIGRFEARWSADALEVRQDQPVSVALTVRGSGNLPLLRAPVLEGKDFEVLTAVVEDSMANPGSLDPGRRRFRWTVLPRRTGTLTLAAPRWAWFELREGRYRVLEQPSLRFTVGGPAARARDVEERFPAAFSEAELDPWHRRARPWMALLSGCGLGVAIRWVRRGDSAEERDARSRRAALEREVGSLRGAEFWAAAERTLTWMAERGHRAAELERAVAAARYGGGAGDEADVRRQVHRQLERVGRELGSRGRSRLVAGAVGILALGLGWIAAPAPGTARGRELALAADHVAAVGDWTRAEGAWRRLWDSGSRAPGLAARLAWGELRAGQVAEASLWVLRGESSFEPDRALSWVRARVREAGGLSGASAPPFPWGALDWSMAAWIAGLSAIQLRSRPRAIGLLAGAVLCAGAPFLIRAWSVREPRAVVMHETSLEGSRLSLEPGRVVIVRARAGARARVRAGRGVEGWMRADRLALPESPAT